MSPNQKLGLYMLIVCFMLYSIPVLIYGIPIPIDFLFLYVISVIPLIAGTCLLGKVFDFDYETTHHSTADGSRK